jgi:hypothetical protein
MLYEKRKMHGDGERSQEEAAGRPGMGDADNGRREADAKMNLAKANGRGASACVVS